MRIFIAIHPQNETLTSVLNEVNADLQAEEFPLHPVPADHNHLTVAYIGEIDQAKINYVFEKLQLRLAQTNEFTLTTSEVVFGNFAGQRLALLVEKNQELVAVRDIILDTLHEVGIEIVDKTYTPHISLTWASRYVSDEEKVRITKRVKGMRVAVNFPVRSISIIKSELTHDSPKYSILYDIRLNSIV